MRMKFIQKLSDFSFFSLQNRYIPALLLIAVFATLAYKNVNDIMVSINNDGSIINLSGRQRMLSLKLIVEAEKYIVNQNKEDKKNLLKTLTLMEESHNFLVKSTLPKNLQKLYFEEDIAQDIQNYIRDFKTLIHNKDQKLFMQLKEQSSSLIIKLNLIVEAFEHENSLKIKELENREKYLYILTLLVLLLEAIFIFSPATKKINQSKKELLKEIRKKTDELQHSIEIIDKNVIYSKTNLKGVITYASEAFCTISGYSREELVGRPHNIVRHFEMPASAFKQMWDQIQQQKSWEGEVKNKKKNGEYYWVNAFIAPEYDLDGNHIGYAAVRHDITHKKNLEQLNIELEKKIQEEIEKNRKKDYQLFEQEKRLRISELIVNISHHWRQPLNMISTCASGMQLQKEYGLLDDQIFTQSTNNIIQATENLSQTLNIFNSFINSNNQPQNIEINTLIDELKNIVIQDLNVNNIKFVVDVPSDSKQLQTIKNDLLTVLTHLIYNARDMLIKRNIEEPFIKLEIYFDENSCSISVEDNAKGISQDIIEKIFDPYVTTKNQSFGIGLGLYKCQMIVGQILNSEIFVHNTNLGAKFTIKLKNLT